MSRWSGLTKRFLEGLTGAGRGAWLRVAIAFGLLLAVAVPAQALVRGIVAREKPVRLIALSHEVIPGLARFHNLGPVPAGRKLMVAITVAHNLNGLYRAEAAVYNPSSPAYHHFLTPAQFRARYGTPLSQVNAIRRFGTAHGLELVNPSVLYDYVALWGTARQVESTFHVALDRFRSSGGQTFFANLESPRVPAGLGIAGVMGLQNLARYHLADHHGATRAGAAGPTQGGCQSTAGVCTGLLSPQALWKAYGAPGAGQTKPNARTDFGQGQSIGIIGEGQTVDVIAALREFEKTRGLPFVPVQVYHTDPGENTAESKLDDSGRIEWEMDTQSSTGMAPEVSQVRLYFGSSLALTELTGAIGTWVNDPNGPLQASASLGACEDTPATDALYGAAQRADQALLAQAALEGRTFFASAGDTGPGCSVAVSENGIQYGPIPVEEYPAIDPNTTAVGGTILYTNPTGTRSLERAWDHTGGGPSKFLPQMPWQQTAGSPFLESNACPGVYADGSPFPQGGNLCRADVDVSAESGDITIVTDHKVGDVYATGGYDPTSQPIEANGFDMVDFCPASEAASENPAQASCGYDGNAGKSESTTTDGTTESGVMTDHFAEGGTSLSSPLWLGMWADVQAHHDAGNSPKHSLGSASPLIYRLNKNSATYARDFYDVTVGSNGPFPAAPGYDYPTGWGTPNVAALTEDASGTPKSTAPARDVLPGTTDPKPLVAAAPKGPACHYAFYVSSPGTAGDPINSDDPQLALVQGTFGLTPDQKSLRVVMNLQNLSKTVPTGFTAMEYQFAWTNPKGDNGPNAVDVQVDRLGDVTYTDGTQTISTTGGQTTYNYTPSSTSDATGHFGSGPDGAVEVDVPLSELGLKVGQTLTGPGAYTAEGEGTAGNQPFGSIVDQAGPGFSYTLGQPTCLDTNKK